MAPDVKKDYLLVGYQYGKRDAVAMGNADRLNPFQFSTQVVKFEVWLKRITFQVAQN